jgi:leucyl-tRNA synthetase
MVKDGDQGAIVERKKLNQWFFKITKFSKGTFRKSRTLLKIGQIKLK